MTMAVVYMWYICSMYAWICIQLLLDRVFCKCWLDPVGWFCIRVDFLPLVLPGILRMVSWVRSPPLSCQLPILILLFGFLIPSPWLCFLPLSTFCCLCLLTFLWHGFLLIYLNFFFYTGVEPINNVW